jgi:putative membrane protein
MRTLWIAPIAALVAAAAPLTYAQSQKPPTPAERQAPGQERTKADTAFIQQALMSGREEVELAKLAAEKSQNAQIKQFAQMLVSDHTAVNEQLTLLGRRDGAATPRDGARRGDADRPASPPAASPGAAPTSAKAQELAKLDGAEFDRRFMAMIVEGHEKSVDLYTRESESGSDPAAKKLAGETLPKIKEHLQQAKSLQQDAMDKKN